MNSSSTNLILIGVLLIALGEVNGDVNFRRCAFPAIYNFGDSNSDTGGRSAALEEVPPPNGQTFFGKPSGRFCDGRLIIDFIAEALGLPYLNAYLDSFATNFRHGANFATGGSSILPGGYSPFHLDIQISQFIQFKSRSMVLYKQLENNRTNEVCQRDLPRPHDFSKALYTFDIGQNDLAHGFQYSSEAQVRASIPSILDEFSKAVHQLYEEGARAFWVHNTGPIGCLPYSVIDYQSKPSNLDRIGCVEPQNEVAQEFNRQLKERVTQLRTELSLAAFTYVDVYSTKYSVVAKAKQEGFEDPMDFCCGSYYGHHIDCGKKVTVNGTVYGNPCTDPSRHISWDGIHYSEAANVIVAKAIVSGSLGDPPHSIDKACNYQ